MTRQTQRTLFGLRTALDTILDKAKDSKNHGDKRTAELEEELREIEARIRMTLEKITEEARASTDTHARAACTGKTGRDARDSPGRNVAPRSNLSPPIRCGNDSAFHTRTTRRD